MCVYVCVNVCVCVYEHSLDEHFFLCPFESASWDVRLEFKAKNMKNLVSVLNMHFPIQ